MPYKIAAPDEYLAITGMSIKNVRITKTAWVWPFQKCTRFSVQPHDYAMDLKAMTKEKLQFLLPVVFTIGPDVNARGANASLSGAESFIDESHAHDEDRGDALLKYAMLLADSSDNDQRAHYLENIVKGIIEGETRVLVSSMTMEEIFTGREVFKKRIFQNIQGELSQFGLKIYNANVKELKDAVGSTYFQSLSQKAHEGATNQARIDVAEAQLRGNVGSAERLGQQERQISKINAETAVQKTDRDIERATAEANLATQKANLNRDVEIARIQANRATESRDEDLKKDVEIKRAAAELERLRASDVVKATISRESKQQAADAKAYEIEAEARAQFERTNMVANANLQKQLREAEGISSMADAYAKLGQAFGGPENLLRYMMIEKGTYVELAKANAMAVQGMQPKISVWNTGAEAGSGAGGSGGGQDSAATMRNIYQLLPPLMSTIHEQTGITLPEWQFGKLPSSTEVAKRDMNHEGSGRVDRKDKH
ncbi:hypothetical protein GGR50DRAFT_690836 [Xylaria sp. CBS 124048]|nr:hypothetical protein GGR50DRAFT_690836 [Xylaria sp. CBS 124048]